MSLKLAFEAFLVFIRTERLSVRVGTFLVHMAWVFFVAMLLWWRRLLQSGPRSAASAGCAAVSR